RLRRLVCETCCLSTVKRKRSNMYSSADPRNKPGFGGKIPHMPKLLDQVREVIRMKHYSIRTEQSYVDWIKRYIFFHNKRHPADMGRTKLDHSSLTSQAKHPSPRRPHTGTPKDSSFARIEMPFPTVRLLIRSLLSRQV